MIKRERYEAILEENKNQPIIKILTGMYRCGKSTLLKGVQRNLRRCGIKYSHILYIDFEAARHSEIRDGGSLLFVVRNLAQDKRRIYLLLDEVCNLPGWEKAVLMLQEQYQCDIYLSGSRSAILKEEVKKELAGRYMEIPVYPFSFLEYVTARRERLLQQGYREPPAKKNAVESDEEQGQDENTAKNKPGAMEEYADYLQDFMIYGNLPGIHKVYWEEDTVFSYLLDVCQAGILQNVVRQWKIRDISQVWMILACVAENLGKPQSAKVIAQELKEEGQSVGKDTVYTILRALTEAQILQKVSRYETKTGKILEAQEKYYFTDWGMYHSLHGTYSGHTQALLENVVCMELLTRGWQVYRIQSIKQQIDFMAVKGDARKYYQICETLPGEKQEDSFESGEKEIPTKLSESIRSLNKTAEEGDKIILFLNGEERTLTADIQAQSVLDFLCENQKQV